MKSPGTDIPPCHIRVDRDGVWHYHGAEIIQRKIVEHFYRHLELDERGRYIIHWRGEKCYLDVEDTPYVVWSVTEVRSDNDDLQMVLLGLSDGTEETLDPASLYIGPGNVPYCRIRHSRFTARFSRKAYYQLARLIEEDPEQGGFFVQLGPRRCHIDLEEEE
jgi:hypothetical protein